MSRLAWVALTLVLISHCPSEVVSPVSRVGQETCSDTCERAGLARGVLDLLNNRSLGVTMCVCKEANNTTEVSSEFKPVKRGREPVYIPLKNYNDKQYVAFLSVYGENFPFGLLFRVLINTVQNFVWLPGTRCNSSHCNKSSKVPQYEEGETENMLIYPGYVSGTFESKQLTLYVDLNKSILFGAQEILLADYAEGFEGAEYNGGFGLNFAGSSPLPLVQHMLRGFKDKVFELKLNGQLEQSWLVLSGRRNDYKFSPLVESGWMIRATEIGSLNSTFKVYNRVLLEPAFPFISGPRESVRSIHKLVNGQKDQLGQYIVQCNIAPVIQIKVQSETEGDMKLSLEPKVYLVNREGGQTLCNSLVIENEGQTDSWILGSPFFRAYDVAFDFTARRMGIGFSPKRKN